MFFVIRGVFFGEELVRSWYAKGVEFDLFKREEFGRSLGGNWGGTKAAPCGLKIMRIVFNPRFVPRCFFGTIKVVTNCHRLNSGIKKVPAHEGEHLATGKTFGEEKPAHR